MKGKSDTMYNSDTRDCFVVYEDGLAGTDVRVCEANCETLPDVGRASGRCANVEPAADSFGHVHRRECGRRASEPKPEGLSAQIQHCVQGSTRNAVLASAAFRN